VAIDDFRLAIGGVVVAVAALLACRGTEPVPTRPAPVTTYILRGLVRSYETGNLAGATVSVTDGPNAGQRATTAPDGTYQLTLASGGGFTAKAEAAGHIALYQGFDLTPITPAATWDVWLVPTAFWSRSGTGPVAFAVPPYVHKLWLWATYPGAAQRFIIRVNGRDWVNQDLGTQARVSTIYGEAPVQAGWLVEILESTGVVWKLEERR
jgi:hypothetical protein